MSGRYVVVIEDGVDLSESFGPFDTPEEAASFGAECSARSEYWARWWISVGMIRPPVVADALRLIDEAMPRDAETVCRHCGRGIVSDGGLWIDPRATGDDETWRATCDANDSFPADHEPAAEA